MNIIQSTTRLPFLEKKEGEYVLNINQRYVTITEGEEEKGVFELYQETFRRFPSIREKLDAVKTAVTNYANGFGVKHFSLNDTEAWLDSEQRSSIKDAVEATIKIGGEEYTLWLNSQPFTLPCSKVLDIISAIELYSSQCYNMTSEFHLRIEQCGADIEKACDIDFTKGYPSVPTFVI